MSFKILKKDDKSQARRAVLKTAHGEVNTPVFMPVGTAGTVKSMAPEDLYEMNAEIILGNTYHLFLRPGMDIMDMAGGLHEFSSWDNSILTDSGGYQVFSLSKLRKVKDNGVEFRSHIDGSKLFLGPKEAMKIQHSLGSDIIMVFDECTPYPCSFEDAEKSLNLTLNWAKQCRDQPVRENRKVFCINQGSVYKDLRIQCAEKLAEIDFEGYAVGGLSVGETEVEMLEVLDWLQGYLPENKPHYLMGVGTPPQILEAVARGVDMFDCVLPTRLARHGTAYTSLGNVNIKAAKYKADFIPIDENCSCKVCNKFTRAYIRHLLQAGELLGMRLMTYHNLFFYLNMMKEVRASLEEGNFTEYKDAFIKRYHSTK